jgi:hypothetical protein
VFMRGLSCRAEPGRSYEADEAKKRIVSWYLVRALLESYPARMVKVEESEGGQKGSGNVDRRWRRSLYTRCYLIRVRAVWLLSGCRGEMN